LIKEIKCRFGEHKRFFQKLADLRLLVLV